MGAPNTQLKPGAERKAPPVERTIRIVLEENNDIPRNGLFLGLNGRNWMLQPGVEVDVPVGIVEILNNAIESIPVIEPQTQKVTGFRNRLRFPYRRVERVDLDA